MTSKILNTALYIALVSGGAYQLFSLFCVGTFFRQRPKRADTGQKLPPISVIKPVKGADPGFRANMESFCSQEYPEYEVLVGLSDPDPGEAASVSRQIEPCARTRMVISRKQLGANRKVSNLQGIVEAARYPLYAISDSDMRVEPTYLRQIASEYQSEKNAGLVTCLYKISRPQSLGAALESLTIAVDFIPSVLTARRLEGVTFGLGASLLLSKKGLEDIGGLSAVADYLADDYQIGNRLWKKGYSIVLSRVVLENMVGPMSLADYVKHQVRWARTYRASRPKGFAGYGITHIVPLSLLLLVLRGGTPLTLSIAGAALAIRLAVTGVVYAKVIRSRGWLRWIPLLPVKDLVSFGIWAWSFAGSTVHWRGRSYRIVKEGRIVEHAGIPPGTERNRP